MSRVKRRSVAAAATLVAIALIMTGCGDDGGSGPGTGTPVTFPLTMGNTWVYLATSDTVATRAEAESLVVVGLEMYNGATFTVVRDYSSGGTEDILMRQSGQDFLVVPPFGSSGSQNPLQLWFERVLEASLPWKYADFDADAGVSWTIASAETVLTVGRAVEDTVRVSVTGSNRGRTRVNVPAGQFTGVAESSVSIRATIGAETFVSADQTVWVADGVGLVKMEMSERDDSPGGTPQTITETSALTAVRLN